MYSSTLTLTWVLDGAGWLARNPGGFTLGNDPSPNVPIVQEAGGLQGQSVRVRKISPSTEFDPRTI